MKKKAKKTVKKAAKKLAAKKAIAKKIAKAEEPAKGSFKLSEKRMYISTFRNRETGNVFECLQCGDGIDEIRKGYKAIKDSLGKYEFLSVRPKRK